MTFPLALSQAVYLLPAVLPAVLPFLPLAFADNKPNPLLDELQRGDGVPLDVNFSVKFELNTSTFVENEPSIFNMWNYFAKPVPNFINSETFAEDAAKNEPGTAKTENADGYVCPDPDPFNYFTKKRSETCKIDEEEAQNGGGNAAGKESSGEGASENTSKPKPWPAWWQKSGLYLGEGGLATFALLKAKNFLRNRKNPDMAYLRLYKVS